MAKEWYLMQSPYNQLSGYESDALVDFGEEGFLEALDSEIAVDVELCNYDLSECETKRVIIQNNHQDTKSKTFQRVMFAQIGTCKAGMYVKYKDRYWLIIGIVDDNKVFEKAILLICNYKLSWVDPSGKIISRWINAESASQYNNGESNARYYFIRSDQLMIYMPDDTDSMLLDSGKRFVIDKRCFIYERDYNDSTVSDTTKRLITYVITRSDTVLDNYTDSGIIGYLITQCEQRPNDGYYVVDGIGYWLCDPPKSTDEPKLLSCDIEYDSDIIYIDLEPCVYTAVFYDADGNRLVDDIPDYEFTIESDFDGLIIQSVDNSKYISISDYKCNGKSFNIVLQADGYETATVKITVKEFL